MGYWLERAGHDKATTRACRAAGLLATASLFALLAPVPAAADADCTGASGAPPADIATPAMLFETLRAHTDAQPLAIGFLRKPLAEECAWIYEVRMLTASGSVVELDFAAANLDLVGARGPDNDRDAAALVRGFGGAATFLTSGAQAHGSASNSGTGSGSGASGSDGSGDDGSGEGGGNSGSGSGGNSGPGGGEGGDSGGEGGNSGPGGGDSDGGEGGGDSGGGEGGEGGNSGPGGGDD